MRRLLFMILFAAAATTAIAEDRAKITVEQAIQLATALRNLDGHIVVIKQNGADSTVMLPWDFGDARLRLRIANDISILDAANKSATDAQQAAFKEVTKKFGVTELKPGTPERIEFDRQYEELMKQPAPGTQDLARVKASELKLDRNEIAVTVLAALRPILEDDVTGK